MNDKVTVILLADGTFSSVDGCTIFEVPAAEYEKMCSDDILCQPHYINNVVRYEWLDYSLSYVWKFFFSLQAKDKD